MKRLATSLILTAAALAAGAFGASAQTMKAEIPFAFRAGRTLMTPGSYTIRMQRSMGAGWIVLSNLDSGRTIILAQYTASDVSRHWKHEGSPKLGFECAGASCVLRDYWPATDVSVYHFLGPKPGGDDLSHVAEIPLTAIRAD